MLLLGPLAYVFLIGQSAKTGNVTFLRLFTSYIFNVYFFLCHHFIDKLINI